MRILVIDDKAENLAIAKEELAGHDLVFASKYEEAEMLLCGGHWRKEAEKHNFDVVLTDLMMPRMGAPLTKEATAGPEAPLGIFLALLAARFGAKMVAVVTDGNHHDDPSIAAMESLHAGTKSFFERGDKVGCLMAERGLFTIGDTRFVLYTRGGKPWGLVLKMLLGTCTLNERTFNLV